MNKNEGSYYWQARKVLGSSEGVKEDESFAQLLGSGGCDISTFSSQGKTIGEVLQSHAFKLEEQDVSSESNATTKKLSDEILNFGNQTDNIDKIGVDNALGPDKNNQ